MEYTIEPNGGILLLKYIKFYDEWIITLLI